MLLSLRKQGHLTLRLLYPYFRINDSVSISQCSNKQSTMKILQAVNENQGLAKTLSYQLAKLYCLIASDVRYRQLLYNILLRSFCK